MLFRSMAATLRKGLYVIAAIGLPALAAAQVPDVIGPIPASLPPGTDLTHNYPQLSSEPTDNLSSRGYIEEEFSSKERQRATRRPHWPMASSSPPAILTRAG
jgi:hypothetical protein